MKIPVREYSVERTGVDKTKNEALEIMKDLLENVNWGKLDFKIIIEAGNKIDRD